LRWYVDRYCLGKNSKTLTSATAASRVYVHESVVSEFVVGLKANFEGANRTLGQSPLDPQTVLRPVADSIQFNRVLDFIKDGERTAQLVTGGKQNEHGAFLSSLLYSLIHPQMQEYTAKRYSDQSSLSRHSGQKTKS
jgi:acyl-CoA reductase-like NAD-dependent aldehyde dehydrogenase